MKIPAWERENFRLNKGNIFPSRKSLVSDIPAGEGKTAKPFFTVHIQVSVSDLYITTIGLPNLLEEICRPVLGLYKSLTDT